MVDETVTFLVSIEDNSTRIDKYIAKMQPELTRSYIQKLIKDSMVFVNGNIVKANYKVSKQDTITMILPPPEPLNILAENIPLDILYEDSDVIVINKGKGMVVHPAAGHYTGTIVNALLYHCKDELSGINGVMRPGIVHRIDMNTTGVIVVCKNDVSHTFIAEQLKEHSITRKYRAIVYNHFSCESGMINQPIGRHPIDRKKMAINLKNGKHAITHYMVLEHLKQNFSYIECQLETGRTHQIRVHMASIGHPLLGDSIYGPERSKWNLEGQVLHAQVLGFIHPSTKEYMEFEAPIPDYFKELLKNLSMR